MGMSADQVRILLRDHGETLLRLAADSIRHTLLTGDRLAVEPQHFAPDLAVPGACFVTLRRHGELRGCVGSSRAWRLLVVDVAGNAAASAFEEPRFPPLTEAELSGLSLSVSVLTVPEPMAVSAESDLLRALRPGRDGLILREGDNRALFLPQVWEMLPSPAAFVTALKEKAGIPLTHWSPTLEASRFEAVSVEREDMFSERSGSS
jgi:MEMO1 family protein